MDFSWLEDLPDEPPPPPTSRTLQPRSRATSLARSSASSSRSTSRRSSFINLAPQGSDLSMRAPNESQAGPGPSSLSTMHGPGKSKKRRREHSEETEPATQQSLPPASQIVGMSSFMDSDTEIMDQLLQSQSQSDIGPSSSSGSGVVKFDYKGKGKAKEVPQELPLDAAIILNDVDSPPKEKKLRQNSPHKSSSPTAPNEASKPLEPELLASYTCPICFFPPTNATLTPCGHICCGSCLFTAVKTTMQRGHNVAVPDANSARCPVCRASIPGWDGKGGGVIGLRVRAIFSL